MTRQNPIGPRAVCRDGWPAVPTGHSLIVRSPLMPTRANALPVAPGRGLPLPRRDRHSLPGPPVLSKRPIPAGRVADAAAIGNRCPAPRTCGVVPRAAVMAFCVPVAVAHVSGHVFGTRVPDPGRQA